MTKFVKANGIRISYEERGNGEPLILLMGLGAPGAKWEPHVKAYEKYFKCIMIDNRGAGQSDKPAAESYTIEEMANDTLGLMDALGIQSAFFNGISMGGAIAEYIAIYHPERVRALVLTSTFPCMNVTMRRAITILRDCCGILPGDMFGKLGQWMIYGFDFQNINERQMLIDEENDAKYPYPMPAYAYKAQCNAILQHDVMQDLAKIKAPTLVAHGDDDHLAPFYLAMKTYECISDSELYVKHGGGHVQHFEDPENYNAASLDFLRRHDRM